MKKQLSHALRKIKLFATDVDGVLTDGGMYYGENGSEMKKFSTRDGMGISLLHKAEIHVVIITSEKTVIVENRAKKLKIQYLYQGITNKLDVMNELRKKLRLGWDEIAYIGDDINDLPLLSIVGFSAVPLDGMDINKETAMYISHCKGGEGCVRDVCDKILKAQDKYKKIVSSIYSFKTK